MSGTIISLLRELLTDTYADIRLTALQQVVPVGECCSMQVHAPARSRRGRLACSRGGRKRCA